MLLYMIRHGQSEDNAARRFSGWANCSLSEKGMNDARETAKRLGDEKFDKVYSSDTLRARQTCEIIRPNAEPVLTDLLREINVGELSGKLRDDCPAIFGEKFINRPYRDFREFGGESTADQMERVRKFLKMLETAPADKVVAFCHEGAIRCALSIVEKRETLTERNCKNGAICIFEYSEGEWSLLEWDV